MNELAARGKYTVRPETAQKIAAEFACGFCDDERYGSGPLAKLFAEKNYLLDTHTAVAWNVLREEYRDKDRRQNAPLIVVSTASPFKFCHERARSAGRARSLLSGTDRSSAQLAEKTGKTRARTAGTALPERLVRFTDVTGKDEMESKVTEFLRA